MPVDRVYKTTTCWQSYGSTTPQPEADRITQAIQEQGDPILERYGKMSSEWIFPKI